MVTEIGSYLRKLRIEKREILKDMAEHLGVSSAFLSAVENGKKRMPNSWYQKLSEIYSLNDIQLGKLKQAVLESSDNVELNIHNASETNKQLAISFARQFDSIDERTSNQILEILRKRQED